ncbi:glycosyltransferase, partial [Mesorhizobium sp. M4B.F.Ca.ET.169.01.1.1]|uniref:glycosyltransferase n=1 Tax=Mesorhizobium sp. M4B.F.Ca.ET.169.01.1.1 TaxID=2563949 RepID=UPI0016799548
RSRATGRRGRLALHTLSIEDLSTASVLGAGHPTATRLMAEWPDLAVVVIGFQAPAELADSVRSVLDQNIPLEVVVVNSGGGDAKALLANGGIE